MPLDKGLEPEWKPLDKPAHQRHHEQDKRLMMVRTMAEKVYGEGKSGELMSGPESRQIKLTSARSVHETTRWQDGGEESNEDYVSSQVNELVETGRLSEWHWPEG